METKYPHEDAEKLAYEKSEDVYKTWELFWKSHSMNIKDNVLQNTQGPAKEENGISNSSVMMGSKKGEIKERTDKKRRWIFCLRHGERVDLTYGSWVPFCFDENGTYTRKDLNMPLTLPERSGGAEAYLRDTPLTRVGELQAQLVGEGLRLAGVRPARVYASPALRCVQTARHMLQGLNDSTTKIRIEPGLFEYTQWYVNGVGPFMTPLELHKAGYNVDLEYKPLSDLDVNSTETLQDFYDRNESIMQAVFKETEQEGENIMFVGHAATLDIMVRSLRHLQSDRQQFPPYQLSDFLLRVPYCALAAVRDRPLQVTSPPCPPSINSSSGRFDWKILLDVGNE